MSGGSPIITELRAIQHTHGFVPVAALRDLSERTGTPLYQLYGVVSSFPHFRTAPHGARSEEAMCVAEHINLHRRQQSALIELADEFRVTSHVTLESLLALFTGQGNLQPGPPATW